MNQTQIHIICHTVVFIFHKQLTISFSVLSNSNDMLTTCSIGITFPQVVNMHNSASSFFPQVSIANPETSLQTNTPPITAILLFSAH